MEVVHRTHDAAAGVARSHYYHAVYQALLTRRYLTSKIMPLLAAAAVLLTTATELIVWSVMGGFLERLIESGRELTGDVTFAWPVAGFAHYEDLVARLEAHDDVAAAAPVIETFGMILLPNGRPEHVTVRGVEGDIGAPGEPGYRQGSYARVTNYAKSLYWRPIETPNPRDVSRVDRRLSDPLPGFWEQKLLDGLRLREVDPQTGELVPAMVLGIEVSKFNAREPGPVYLPIRRLQQLPDGSERVIDTFLPNTSLTLTVLPLDEQGRNIDVAARRLPVANEVFTGFYPLDSSTVWVELSALQSMLRMGRAVRVTPANPFAVIIDPETGEERPAEPVIAGVEPARVTNVLVRGAAGVSADDLKRTCLAIYDEFASAHAGEVPSAFDMEAQTLTWREQNAMYISIVEKEIILVMFIFGVVSFTSVFLVLAIFWAMISEKTRDIGVLRALGAHRAGIAWLWLRYGLAIGLVGGALGVVTAALIVHNINPIHEWLGRAMGIQMWDPRVYLFASIPNTIVPRHAAVIFLAGVLASVLGAAWPAIRAASMDPVKALRFE